MSKAIILSGVLLAAIGAQPVKAAVVNWDLTSPPGNLGDTHDFVASGKTLAASGFLSIGGGGTALFAKTAGGNETGLGLANDPTGDNEITGTNFIQLAVPTGVSGFNFSMGSTTQEEVWSVFGSNDPGGAGLTALFTDVGDQGVVHALPDGFKFYDFFYSGAPRNECGSGCGANVLLASFSGSTPAIPEPATWAMMLIGFLGLAFGAMTRKRLRELY